ncbi:MAG: serine/threonine protein kinase, partial [Nannocystaceae bacterium]
MDSPLDLLATSAPPRPPRGEPGDVLGNRYELVERVARGGTGTVFRGYDRSLDRTVAIKVAYAGETKVREHLLREARIGAKIHHP